MVREGGRSGCSRQLGPWSELLASFWGLRGDGEPLEGGCFGFKDRKRCAGLTGGGVGPTVEREQRVQKLQRHGAQGPVCLEGLVQGSLGLRVCQGLRAGKRASPATCRLYSGQPPSAL